MNPLDVTKSGFLLCIAVCMFIYTFIYLKDTLSAEPDEQKCSTNRAECGFYPDELCSALFVGKTAALKIGSICQNTNRPAALSCVQTPCNCSVVLKALHFITRPLSAEEGNFSLAYIITIHKELEMFVKLLRAIYMPQNIYCIHVDEKSPTDYKAAVQNIVNCFENIFISSKRENVVYAGFSRLQADINCMRDLVHSKIQWNYVINLCGQDYPIKTNKDIIKYIKSKWNGKNMTPGVVQPLHMKHRTQVSYREYVHSGMSYVYPTKNAKTKPPYNLTIYFGSAYYILTKEFVEFTLTDVRAKDLLEWSRDTYSPDEHYWVTLNRLHGKMHVICTKNNTCSDSTGVWDRELSSVLELNNTLSCTVWTWSFFQSWCCSFKPHFMMAKKWRLILEKSYLQCRPSATRLKKS